MRSIFDGKEYTVESQEGVRADVISLENATKMFEIDEAKLKDLLSCVISIRDGKGCVDAVYLNGKKLPVIEKGVLYAVPAWDGGKIEIKTKGLYRLEVGNSATDEISVSYEVAGEPVRIINALPDDEYRQKKVTACALPSQKPLSDKDISKYKVKIEDLEGLNTSVVTFVMPKANIRLTNVYERDRYASIRYSFGVLKQRLFAEGDIASYMEIKGQRYPLSTTPPQVEKQKVKVHLLLTTCPLLQVETDADGKKHTLDGGKGKKRKSPAKSIYYEYVFTLKAGHTTGVIVSEQRAPSPAPSSVRVVGAFSENPNVKKKQKKKEDVKTKKS